MKSGPSRRFLFWAAVGLSLLVGLFWWGHSEWIVLGWFFYELAVSFALFVATGQALRKHSGQINREEALRAPSGLSVIIAAHNETAGILATIRSVLAQRGAEFEIIVASDGSLDGMNELLVREFSLTRRNAQSAMWDSLEGWPVRLLTLPKAGKAVALNQALLAAQYEVVVTLDADTQLAPEALRAFAQAFQDPRTLAAGGFLYARPAAQEGWLTWFQSLEYVKSFMVRLGLSHGGVLLQVSGALGAFRASWLRRVGGFDPSSLTEDYEIIYRLHQQARKQGVPYRIVAVPEAVGFTEVPSTWSAWSAQRRRWFAGFLQTLWDYRHLIGQKQMGRIGWVMLPIKCVDALLPWWTLSALLIGGLAWRGVGRPGLGVWLSALLAKWAVDVAMNGFLLHWHQRAFPGRIRSVAACRASWCLISEGWSYQWLRSWVVLPSYLWCWRRLQRREQPTWKPTRTAA